MSTARTSQAGHAVVNRTLLYVIENFNKKISIDDLAGAAGVSKFSLCKLFQKRFGVSPVRLVWIFRTTLAREFIAYAPEVTLTEIAFLCGFSGPAHFSRLFKQQFHHTPSEIQCACRGGRRELFLRQDPDDGGAKIWRALDLLINSQIRHNRP